MPYKDYTDPSATLDLWLSEIAPKYFDFETKSLYRSGVFGYVNEIMNTVSTDGSRAIATARREFYPTTALYAKSYYKMGALHQLSYPLATASYATAILLMKEEEIIKYAEHSGGIYKYVLDNTMPIMANGIEFRLDFPIIILAKLKNLGALSSEKPETTKYTPKDKYLYTVRYDKKYVNSLNLYGENYIKSMTVVQGGERLLMMKVGLHQVTVDSQFATINSSPNLTNVTLDFRFEGQLCNFEVFYQEATGGEIYQLTKVPKNANPFNGKFCMYSIVDDNTIRLEFPTNAYFNPKFNSTVSVDIYTTLGSAGKFTVCNVDLKCTPKSENYPYNNTTIVLGQIIGSSIGGADFPELDDFKQDVIAAYATNKTYVTDRDLQVYFDITNRDKRNKILFFKRRDDVFERLFGAFMLVKDTLGNVIPTNSLTMEFPPEVLVPTSAYNKYTVRAGTVWTYQNPMEPGKAFSSEYNLRITPLDINYGLDDDTVEANSFYYTCPFLIHVSTDTNAVGFYLNTIETTIPMSTESVNDSSLVQFNISSFSIQRNAIAGENFYKLTIYLQPSLTDDDLTSQLLFTAEELKNMKNADPWETELRAQFDGFVERYEYIGNSVYMIIRYTPDIPALRKDMITWFTEPEFDNSQPDDSMRTIIRISGGVSKYEIEETGDVVFKSNTFYSSDLKPGDRFTKGSIIAFRDIQDTGILRVIGEMETGMNGLYIPFAMEKYDPDTDLYTFTAYLSTNDNINDNGRLEIISGFIDRDGNDQKYVSIDPNECNIRISAFVQHDTVNDPHAYSTHIYVKNHTLTNTYYSFDQKFDFLRPYKFIRSILSFNAMAFEESEDQIDNEAGYYIRLTEVPVVRASWLKNSGNVSDFITMLNSNYDFLVNAYNYLENNFSIDMKFFNTFGKSRFYRVGIENESTVLNRVNIIPKFGIKLSALTNYEEFKARFYNFVRDYIESFNSVDNTGKTIFLMDLVSEITQNFPEIEKLEYYGIDDYNANEAQSIESLTDKEIKALGYNKYVPEFINVYSDYIDEEFQPIIKIVSLE